MTDDEKKQIWADLEEESFFLGAIPLQKFKQNLEQSKKEVKYLSFDTCAPGYCTDAVLKILRDVYLAKIKKKSKYKSQLCEIDLRCCSLVSDNGIGWLAEIISFSPNLTTIKIDGCTKVTDCGVSALKSKGLCVHISAMATSVTHLNLGSSTKGCPLLIDEKSQQSEDYLQCYILVVPHEDLKNSFAEYLYGRSLVQRESIHHISSWTLQSWNIALTEFPHSNPLFESLVPKNPVQVLIPFDASLGIKQIRSHISKTITRILSKETVNPPHKNFDFKITNSELFFDTLTSAKCVWNPDGILRSLSTSERVIACYVSRQPLSRTNCYFEIECLAQEGSAEAGVVLGIIHDNLFSDRFPMESNQRDGGAVEGFVFRVGDVVGFGIHGSWDSEYVPSSSCSFYYTVNGSKREDKISKEKPHTGMYPVVSVFGKSTGEIRLKNYASPPEELQKKWENEKLYIEPGFSYCILWDEDGVLTYTDNYKAEGHVGLFVSQHPITKAHNSCTIEILGFGKKRSIALGIGPEDYKINTQLGDVLSSVAVYGDGRSTASEKASEPWKEGDFIKAVVSGFSGDMIESGEEVTVTFYRNDQKLEEMNLLYKKTAGIRCVFLIAMQSADEKVKILNFRRPYQPNPLADDKLTMGRCNYINVYDDGTLTYYKFNKEKPFGLYVSKTPISKSLPYFEMKVLKIHTDKHVGIGLCHRNYKINEMPGWLGGSIAYHADNGQLYMNASAGLKTLEMDTDKLIYGEGDVVGCGVEAVCVGKKLKPQQTIRVFFTKNGTRIHEYEMEYNMDGLYPCVSLHYETDKVQLYNFSSACHTVEKSTLNNQCVDNPEEESPSTDTQTEGCHFLVVAVGDGSCDPAEKIAMVKQSLDLSRDLDLVGDLEKEIKELERNLDSLRVQGQQYYSNLSWRLQCLKRIIASPHRLHFLAVNTNTGQGYDDLVSTIVLNQKTDQTSYPKFYKLDNTVKEKLEKIVSVVQTHGVIPISELDETTGGIFSESCHLYSRAVKFLHKKGQLVYLPSRISHLALDMEFVKKRLQIGVGTEPNEQVGKRVPCVGETTRIWTKDIISELLKEKGKNMHTVLVYLGIMRLPCIRTKPEDPVCLFTTLDKLQPTEAKLSDFWANGKELENTVVMSRCYKFANGLPPSLLSATMTLCSNFSRPVLLCSNGGVFQSGAVQTVIIQHNIQKGEAVTIESKCFCPENDNETIDEDTKFHIEEYTWQAYCIFCDIIDFYIANQGLVTIIEENEPQCFVNTSIGCSHDWTLSDLEHPQTVCTMCNLCCDSGIDCKWSGIMGQYLRECCCGTKVNGCRQCGICKRCADELWQIQSFLRPCIEVSQPSKTGKHSAIPINGVTSNEVECINLDISSMPICLQKQNDSSGAVIQVFPGAAVEIPSVTEIEEYNKKRRSVKSKLRFDQGDVIKIKLTEIPRTEQVVADVDEEDEVVEIKPVYHTIFCRETRIWHDTGILCYDSASPSIPVGQFCAAQPLTPECNKFSIEIIEPGELRTISIGLCHKRYLANQQPGWASSSIGFHADDGGIFVASGWPLHKVGEVFTGDKMTCQLDVDRSKVIFYHNDKQVYESNKLRMTAMYPIVGLHSEGEVVRLLDKEPWLPPQKGDLPPLPAAFDCKKYGNLWISPGHTLHLLSRAALHGWLLLHNPSKDLIGFMITANSGKTALESWSYTGYLEPHKSRCIRLKHKETPSTLNILWFNLEFGKKYTEEEIQIFRSHLNSERLHSHSLKVTITAEQLQSATPLRIVVDGDKPDDKDFYILEILKNGGCVEKYWLGGGAYHCLIPDTLSEEPSKDIYLRYPKSPTFDQPNMFQKGMRMVAQLYENVYAECMIVSVSEDNQTLALEYSPKDCDENDVMQVRTDSEVIQLKEVPLEALEDVKEKMGQLKSQSKKEDKKSGKIVKDERGDDVEEPKEEKAEDTVDSAPPEEGAEEDAEKAGGSSFTSWGKESRHDRKRKAKEVEEKRKMKADIEVLGYETRGNISAEKRAYLFPPLHLLTESAQFAIIALDPNWKENSLISQAKCQSIPTRVTVQEYQIMECSRNLPMWVQGSGKDGKIDQAFAFLPQSLDRTSLCHPSVSDMFEKVDVHRLCFLVDQVFFALDLEELLDIPIHFVNIPPITPKPPLKASLMYANIFSGWTYTTLIATKLLLPLCDKVFPGGRPDFSREQLEVMMYQLLQIYTAQCHIIAEQYGSLQNQHMYNSGTAKINSAISYDDVNVKTTVDVEDSSYLLKRKFRNHCLCKTHLWTLEKTSMSDEASVDLTMSCFTPYEETVNCFARDLYTVKSLPPDLFEKFSNLQYFSLDVCEAMKRLPEGISGCRRLSTISLCNIALTSLPPDIFVTPQLENLTCSNLMVKTLPGQWPASSKLTRLVLSGLQLEAVPKEICKLQELHYLDLSFNPLTDLPIEFGELKKLKSLSLCGMPWISMDHNKTITFDIYTDWFNDRPYIQNFLSKEKIMQMYSECDVSKNGMLDVEDIARLNLRLFWEIPRIGSKNLNDEEYGGIPPAIFLLTSLEELFLDHQAIVAVPAYMCRLLNLRVLSLTNNPLLESLPGSLGHLPNIRSIDLMSCPSLCTPPNEVVSRGFESVKAYLKRLAGGFAVCRRTKLMFVGLGGAGKTSLLKALMSPKKRTDGTKGEAITDGIIIQPWTIKNSDGLEVTYNTWDFAGQTLYYNTHQFFLSKRAIYLLLWSTRQGFEHAGLDFWLSSVACHAPHTPIFVVGTHCDQVPKADIPQHQLKERYPQIVGFHFISSVQGKGIAELEQKMLEVTLAQKNMGEKIPQVWLSLEEKILTARRQKSILEWGDIKAYGMDVGIYDEKDIREAIQFLHELGTVQYFDNDFLRDHVVINPQWIVNVMSCVVSVKNSPIQDKNGRFEHVDIPVVWKNYPVSLHNWLLQLTEEFDLTFPIPSEPVNIVPCLLPHEVPKNLEWPSIEGLEGIRETKIVYKFTYLPAGLFNRAQVRLFQFSSSTLIWKRGSLLQKNNHLALIEQSGDSELIVKVQGPRPENVIFLVHEIFESLIEESFHGVVYHFLVPCPDCVLNEGTLEPSLFESELISHAKDCKAPFLQCRKYFHTVSMGQLQDSVPDVSDFDTQLHSRIIALQQLNDDRMTDVAILYSALDLPHSNKDNKSINPIWIKNDLEKEKFSVWFCDDMEKVSTENLVWGIKNSKVVVALLSDNFEGDKEKCADMLWYAMDGLKKPYVITVITESLAWQDTDLGMKIGKQELMVMIKNESRYKDKVKDLFDIVRDRLTELNKKETKDTPTCFVSYSWSNSKDAVEKGTKPKEGSVGWGDPRVIKKHLEDSGFSTWIDYEKTTGGGGGLFQRLASAIRHTKVFIACVSNEYAESENCMMELRFAVLNIDLPIILCVVGTNRGWDTSEIGILSQRSKAARVYFQKENPEAFNTLIDFVKQAITSRNQKAVSKKKIAKLEKSELKKKQAAKMTNISFQEEYELIQRKFMRHIISFTSLSDSSPMPRLIVLDFDVKTESCLRHSHPARDSHSLRPTSLGRTNLNITSNLKLKSKLSSVSRGSSTFDELSEASSPTSVPMRGIRPKALTRSRDKMEPFILDDESENWELENFCIKILCEHEEGWHESKKSYPFRKGDDFFDTMRKLAPYLFRLYCILKQSSVQLNCFVGERGRKFQEWIDKESQHIDFLESFKAIREILADDNEAADFLGQLCRCRLPSGKVYWLCEEHQSGPRITRLSPDTGTSKNQHRVIFPEDTAMKEMLEKSDIFKKRKLEKSKSVIKLPPASNADVITSLPRKISVKNEDKTRQSAFESADAGFNFKPDSHKSGKLTKTHPTTGSRKLSTFDSVKNPTQKTVAFSVADSEIIGDTLPARTSDSASDNLASLRNPQQQLRAAANVAAITAAAAAATTTAQKSGSKTCEIQ